MALVLDASIVHGWAFDEGHLVAQAARERLKTDTAYAPSLWWFEVRNGLIAAERRGRIAQARTARFLRELADVAVTIDTTPDDAAVMGLARRHRLTVYDAAYLELALRHALPLATLDKALAGAAAAEGVAPVG